MYVKGKEKTNLDKSKNNNSNNNKEKNKTKKTPNKTKRRKKRKHYPRIYSMLPSFVIKRQQTALFMVYVGRILG